MIYLLLSIATSVITVSFFKLFEKYKVHTFQAIIVNYGVCVICGNLAATVPVITTPFWTQPWFPFAVALGLLFISIFYCIGQTAQKMGVSVSMVAAKLSVAIPVLFAVFLHGEKTGLFKAGGILLSFVAVYLISVKGGITRKAAKGLWLLPVLVFFGSGAIDTLLNFIEARYIPPSDAGSIVSTIFLCAFLAGTLFYLVTSIKIPFEARSLLWGAGLGIPNYCSMFFLVKTLENFEASHIFPINNIGIVVVSTSASILFFKEKLTRWNWIGFVLALVSILIMSFA